jgi:hypothetical protein
MTTAISPAVTLDSHDAPIPCSLCGGAMTAQDDLDVCVCGSRRVRSRGHGLTERALADVTLTVEEGDELLRLLEESRQHSTLVPRDLSTAAASRDDSIRNLHAELLHMLQEMADVSDAWCVAEMARLDVVLNNG